MKSILLAIVCLSLALGAYAAPTKVVVYTAHEDPILNALAPRFEKDTGIKLEYVKLGSGDIMGVWEPLPEDEDIQHHAVLRIAGVLLDGDGASTPKGLIRRFSQDEGRGRVELRPFDFDTGQRQGVDTRPGLEDEVISILDSRFNQDAVRRLLSA